MTDQAGFRPQRTLTFEPTQIGPTQPSTINDNRPTCRLLCEEPTMKKTQSTRLARLLIALLVLMALISPSGTALAAGTGQESAPGADRRSPGCPHPGTVYGDAPTSTGLDPVGQAPTGVDGVNAATGKIRYVNVGGSTT